MVDFDEHAADVKTPAIDVILNGTSGTAEEGSDDKLRELFDRHGCRVRLHRVEQGEKIPEVAAAAIRDGARVIVAGGGDGTINAVAAEVAGTDAVLGVLPLGTLNHFAKDLGIPLEIEEAVAVIAAGREASVDIAEVNGHCFINNSSIGIYPRIVHAREQWQHRHGLGKGLALALAVIDVLRGYRQIGVRLEVEGKARQVSGPFVFVGNNEYNVEGFDLGSRDSLSGGLLSVYVAHRVGRLGLLGLLLRALVGRLRTADGFDVYTAREISVEPHGARVDVSTDGEIIGMKSPLEYRIRPGALRVIVPAPTTA